MVQFWSLVIAGAVSGGLYAIMASGLVLTYQASGIFNVGQGAVAFVTALTYFQLHQPTEAGGLGLGIVPAAIISILIVAPLIGVLLDVALFRRLAKAPDTARLVGTVGVLIALPAGALWLIDTINTVFGSEMPSVAGDAGLSPPGIGPTPPTTWSISSGISINSDQVAVLLAAAVAALGLWYLMRHTRLGLETRAGVDKPVLAQLRGIDTDRSSRIVWALSTMLAGCAGVLIAPLFDLAPITFDMIVFTSFTAAVAARLRSLPWAFAAGLALGVIQNIVYGYAPDFLTTISGFRSSVPFLLLFVLLFFVRGRGGRAAGSIIEEVPAEDPLADLPTWRRRLPWVVAGALFVLYGLFVANDYWTGILNRGLVLALVFLSFVVVTGIGGMINLAQATFVTVGGFTAGWLVNHQWPSTVPILMDNGRLAFWVALILSVVIAAAVGVLVALPSLRLGGVTLALATLALAFIGDRLVFQLEGVRNGSRGWSVRRPALGPLDLGDDRVLFVTLFVIVVAVVGIVGNLTRSATGRALLALRSSPVGASTAGVDPMRTKLVLFAVSAGLAGFAGAWFALVNSPMTNMSAPPLLGLVWLAVAVTFGIRRPGGAVVAGIVYASLPVVLSGIGAEWSGAPWGWLPESARHIVGSPDLAALLFGLGAVSLAREPDGVLAETSKAMRARRLKRSGSSTAERSVATVDRSVATSEPTVPTGEPTVATEAGPTVAPVATRADDDLVADGDMVPERVGTASRQVGMDAAGMNPVLELVGVDAGYGEVQVLHGIDLAVTRGSALAILGANGAGKSTLSSTIAGLVSPSRGQILWDGVDITDMAVHERARKGIVLAPEARGIFPGLSVDDNLAVRLRTDEARQSAKSRFPILAERHAQLAGLLSGGEQQQLAMAVALADPPALFIADEPSLGLSPMASIAVFEALAELHERGTTLILVEEQAGGALALADRVVLMDLGRVVWAGPADEADLDHIGATYLGV
ncbi:MAG: ATP-binding cassette domain-containing protein [Microthrixaceae bacterium]